MYLRVLIAFLALGVLNENVIITETKSIASYINKLMMDFDAKSSSTNDVAVLKLNKVEGSNDYVDYLYEDICKSIPKSMPLHLPPMQAVVEYRNLRPSSFTIIVSDESNFVSKIKLELFDAIRFALHNCFFSIQLKLVTNFITVTNSEYYSNEEKFIFVAVAMEISGIQKVFQFFNIFKILNVLVIGYFNNNMFVVTYDPFKSLPVYDIDTSLTNVDQVFPDKLLDLSRYTYRIIGSDDEARLRVVDGITYGVDIAFMQIVAEKQNAQLSLSEVKSLDVTKKTLVSFLVNATADIFINTGMVINTPRLRYQKLVNTFDMDGFCVMVPFPKLESYFDFMFKPFGIATWIIIVASLLLCTIIWHFLNKNSKLNSNSAGYFIFGFISNFFGQSIPFREHRASQKIILQSTVVLTFILGTLYQGEIISSITNISRMRTIKTIEEMINMNYSYVASNLFTVSLNSSDFYHRIKANIIGDLTLHRDKYKTLSSKNIALIGPCNQIDDVLFKNIAGLIEERQVAKFYYKVEEKINTFYLEFPLTLTTFHHRRLQEIRLRVFETGLLQPLPVILQDNRKVTDVKYYENEDYYLKLVDIKPAFYLLAFGLAISSITFAIEFFCDSFLYRLKTICGSFMQRFVRMIRNRPRVIEVRPIHQDTFI